jgi:hypothetical protein
MFIRKTPYTLSFLEIAAKQWRFASRAQPNWRKQQTTLPSEPLLAKEIHCVTKICRICLVAGTACCLIKNTNNTRSQIGRSSVDNKQSTLHTPQSKSSSLYCLVLLFDKFMYIFWDTEKERVGFGMLSVCLDACMCPWRKPRRLFIWGN